MQILGVEDALGLVVLRLQRRADLVKAGKGLRSFRIKRDFEGRTILQVTVLKVDVEDDVLLFRYFLHTRSKGSCGVWMYISLVS